MSVDFETPTAALFARLATLTGAPFQYTTRVLEDWDSSAPAKQPALMLTSGEIAEFTPKADQVGLIVPMWKVSLLAVIYVQAPNPRTKAPSEILNPLIAAVCNALLAQPSEPRSPQAQFPTRVPGQFSTTLGGLCAYCRVAGTIKRSEGLVGHVAASSIPIEMVISS